MVYYLVSSQYEDNLFFLLSRWRPYEDFPGDLQMIQDLQISKSLESDQEDCIEYEPFLLIAVEI